MERQMAKIPNMKRWSDEKLEKELAFARAAKDERHPENMAWLAACEAEMDRRDSADELAGIQSLAGLI